MKILPAFLMDHMTLLPKDHSFPTFPKLRGGFANVNKLIGDYHVDCLIIIILLLSNTIIIVKNLLRVFPDNPITAVLGTAEAGCGMWCGPGK